MALETICAPATSPFNSALAIIRMSGTLSLSTVSKLFSNPSAITARKASYGTVSFDNKAIDDVVLTYFQAPHSFTGEDTVEISCHGNPLIVQKILMALTSFDDVRLAEPGEFSKRAFMNGKIDLTESEAINNIIQAKSEWEVGAALDQMHGSLKHAVNDLKERLILLKANIEAAIDFSQEEIEFVSYDQAIAETKAVRDQVVSILQRCKTGEKVSHGIDVAIVGKPNAGKSSILNMIINSERAIVSDIPGTTRDILRESVQINGVHINLIDTAGIRNSEDTIEKIGIERTKKAISDAHIIIAVFDKSTGLLDEDREILNLLPESKVIPLLNKSDIHSSYSFDELKGAITFSTVTGEGFTTLEKSIAETIAADVGDYQNSFLADMRIITLLESAKDHADSVERALENEEPEEIAAFEIHELISCLQEITGEISSDDILGSIFSRFCIGK